MTEGKDWEYYESNFSEEELDEIDSIYDFLRQDEVIEILARQSKIKPGGKLIAPETIFVTTKRVIMKEPNTVGLRDEIYSLKYEEISEIIIERGVFTSKLIIVAKDTSRIGELFIDSISKEKTAEMYSMIQERIS